MRLESLQRKQVQDAISVAPMFEDNNQVIERSGAGVRKYQENNVFKTEQTSNIEEKRPFADYSDQESNSPNIDSQQTNN